MTGNELPPPAEGAEAAGVPYATYPMATSKRPASWRRPSRLVALFVLLSVVAAGLIVVFQHRRDTDLYETGHEAFLQGDCEAALDRFDELLGAWHLLDTADLDTKANVDRDECLAVMNVYELMGKDPAAAIAAFEAFGNDYPDSALALADPASVTAALAGALTTEQACSELAWSDLSGGSLVYSRPELQIGCAEVFLESGLDQDAYQLAQEVLFDAAGHVPAQGVVERTVDRLAATPDTCAEENPVCQGEVRHLV